MPGTSSALEPEWSLLRAACAPGDEADKQDRICSFLRSGIRWKVLFDLADRHAVQPSLAQTLLNISNSIPEEPKAALRDILQKNLHKSLLLSRELLRIVDRLSGIGLDVIPYKGIALAETLYGDIALRRAGDIDLLIRAADLQQVREAVRELGYTPHVVFSATEEKAYLESGYEYAFDAVGNPNLLELQWAILPKFYAVDFDMNSAFRRAVTVPVAGHAMKTLGTEDLFIVLAVHAAKHAWERLIWLCDLARIMTLPTLNWREIGSQAKALGVVRILGVTLLLVNRVFEEPIPGAADSALPQDSGAAQLVDEIYPQLGSPIAYPAESFAYFHLMLRLRERRADQLRFLSRLAFTPGPGEWAAVRLPRPLFPLYRMVRLSRLAARLVRT